MSDLTKSQIDKLGDRLREGEASENDLRLLDEYRRSFSTPFQSVLEKLRRHGQVVKGRSEKTRQSIVSKLQRTTMKLSRMQDIAGCRIVVRDILEQDHLVEALKSDFPDAVMKDRRASPSYGYRAVHLLVKAHGKTVEIQVRTELQQMWAEASEKAFDRVDPMIKYGGGPETIRDRLENLSKTIADHEIAQTAARLSIETSVQSLIDSLDDFRRQEGDL